MGVRFLTPINRVGYARIINWEGITMKVEVKNGKLLIEMDLQTPAPSSSGKTLVVASTRGNKATGVLVDGKEIVIGVNAYVHR